MKVHGIAAPVWAAWCVAALAAAEPSAKVIYGSDDRSESSESGSKMHKKASDSTVALFQGGRVRVDDKKKKAELTTSPFTTARVKNPDGPGSLSVELCEGEKFKGQGKGAFCSGSLVAPDLILTAGHCIEDEEGCKDTKFVFGFRADGKGKAPGAVPAGEVYGCGALVARKLEGKGPDWAVVRLDRTVENHVPLRVRRSGAPPAGTPIAAIGHPVGLPTKVTDGASIRKNDEGGYFVANLDTYGGNSGSAVVNEVSGEVEGILVRGDTDFELNKEKGCAKSVKRRNDTGRGEDVTLVAEALEHIPKPSVDGMRLAKSKALGELKSLAGSGREE